LEIAFPEALSIGHENLISEMTNEPNDRHVLAAAVHSRAEVLVTWNTRHFRPEYCEPYGISIQTPDDFLCSLWNEAPTAMSEVLQQQASDLVNPLMTVEELLGVLEHLVPSFAHIARRT
jgi:hypothetical protein